MNYPRGYKVQMGLAKYVGRRVLEGLIILFIIMTIIFFLFRATGVSPIDMMAGGARMSVETREALVRQHGLDKPLWTQYFIYIKNLLKGDLGVSLYTLKPVSEIVMEKLPRTLLLFFPATIISYVIGIIVGRRIGWKRGKKIESGVTITALVLGTLPVFWLALLMLYIFSFKLELFPLGGWVNPEVLMEGNTGAIILDVLYHMILPVMTLVIIQSGGALLLMRTSMIETLGEDYIFVAKAKGMPEKVVRDKHAARNAMLPIITSFTISVALSVGGNVLVEKIFSWPGLGLEMFNATVSLDYPLAQGCFLIMAALVIVFIILTDVLYAYLDPRISYG